MTIFIVLPAYNEAQNLPPLFDQIFTLTQKTPGNQYKTILVDDGSADQTDKTGEPFKTKLDIVVEKHQQNLGLGAASRTGLRRALELGKEGDVIVTMDADNSHPPALIPKMLEKIQAGSDVVIASRYCSGAKELGLSPMRSALSQACS